MGGDRAGGYILVVDDNEMFQSAIGMVLADAGYPSREAHGGREALRQLGAGPLPRLVLVDLKMPDLDGVELLRELRRQHPTVPVILMSGARAVDPAARDANGYLQKPFGRDELLAVVERAWG